MALKTRQPTGQASWPLVLLAGVQGAGKSFGAAVASASPVIGRALWVSIGERDPDDYGAVRDLAGNFAQFEIVEHDGSYAGIRQAFADAVAEPPVDGKPTLLIGDSMSRLWTLIGDNAQAIANRKAQGKRAAATGDYTITPDLWNQAAQQWSDVMEIITSHQGPTILTARLDSVTVMENGQPTKEKTWKVQGHKSLPYDVDAEVHMYERGAFMLMKVKSVSNPLARPTPVPNFTVPWLWEQIGVQGMGAARRHTQTRTDEAVAHDRATAGQLPGMARPQTPPQTPRQQQGRPPQQAQRPQQQRPQGQPQQQRPQQAQAPQVGPSGRRWVYEAREASTKEALKSLFDECRLSNELTPDVERELMRIAATLPDEAETAGEWAPARPAGEAWVENPDSGEADVREAWSVPAEGSVADEMVSETAVAS